MAKSKYPTGWVEDISEMHAFFGVNKAVDKLTPEHLRQFMEFRLNFLQEELDEAKEALASGQVARAEDITDAMVDLVVVALGTLDAFGVDAETAWDRVHAANMAKKVGIKKERPNPLGLPDLVKPEGWTAPSHADNIGTLWKLFV